MTENTTNSAELRQFAADNTGRRKIDVEASLDLHRRAANHIDALSEHVNDLRQRVTTGGEAPAAAPPVQVAGETPSQSALMVLQQAQQTADQTLAEANQVLAEAERTRREADALAQAKADTALAQARVEAAGIIEAAEARADEIAAASAVAAERVAEAQRSYLAKAAELRADAEGVVALARSMENIAGENLPAALTEEPFTKPIARDQAVDEQQAPAVTIEAAAEEATAAELPPPPAPPADDLLPPPPAPEVAVATSELPPPPAPVATDELVDLDELDLEQALDGKSIDDELFGDDVVIDLTDEAEDAKRFEFFSRD